MKRLINNCLVVMIALVAASTAGASEMRMTSAYAGQPLNIGDEVTVQVHFDATTTGIQLFGSNFLFDPLELVYIPQSNEDVGVGDGDWTFPGGGTTYILYGMSGMASVSLFAQQNPWVRWPGQNVPGKNQVNVNWADPSFAGTFVTGSNIKIADLKFQVIAVGDGSTNIEMSITAAGGIFQVSGDPVSPITLVGSPITLNLPEPAVGALSMAALVSLAMVRRRARKA